MQGNGQSVSRELFHLDPAPVGKHHLHPCADIGSQLGATWLVTVYDLNPLTRSKLTGFFHQEMIFRQYGFFLGLRLRCRHFRLHCHPLGFQAFQQLLVHIPELDQ